MRGHLAVPADMIGPPSTEGQTMSSAGSIALPVYSRSGLENRAQVHRRRIVFQRKKSVSQTLGDVDGPVVIAIVEDQESSRPNVGEPTRMSTITSSTLPRGHPTY